MSDARVPAPYRSGLATGLGVVLLAGLLLALVDAVHTGGGAGSLSALLGLWSIVTLPVALAIGIVLAAGNATWGAGWIRGLFRRLRDDAELDRRVSAILIAAAILGGVLALAISKLAMALVAQVNRQSTGALLLGVVVVGIIPVIALGALPLYRVARRLTAIVPALGPLSRVVVLVLGAAVAMAAAGFYVVTRKLDYEALNLGSLVVPALLPVLAIAIGGVAWGPLSAVRERIRSRGAIAAAGALIAVVLPVVALRSPSETTRTAVADRSFIGPRLVPALRKLIDRDHDGFSPLFGGPDCDDDNASVFPGADEIPGNGLDDNCVGGDGKVEPPANPSGAPDAGVAAPTVSGGNNVLIVFVDTLRFDRLGFTGYRRDGRSLTPRLDAFANQAVVFRKAFAQAPNTPRSVPSFLASKYPSQLKVDRKTRDYPAIHDDNDLLFEALKPAGFSTYGMSSHFYFCDRARYPKVCGDVAPWMAPNILQGADEWDNTGAVDILPSNKELAGPRIVKKTIAKLDELARSRSRFAMLVHLFEPHSTYMPHDGFKYTERGEASLAQKYDYEIAATDQLIGELLDAIDHDGLATTTTVVVMSDHGEAFGVHTFAGTRMFFHGQTLYRELLHVPLMFRVPGVAPRMADDVVQLIDLAPTIAALFGVAAPASWQGRSLVAAIEGKPLEPRPAFAELLPADAWKHDAKSMITADGARHVFYRISDSLWEIYDLVADPDERTNVASSDPKAKELEAQVAGWIEGPLAQGARK